MHKNHLYYNLANMHTKLIKICKCIKMELYAKKNEINMRKNRCYARLRLFSAKTLRHTKGIPSIIQEEAASDPRR